MSNSTILIIYLAIGALYMTYNVSRNLEDRAALVGEIRTMMGDSVAFWGTVGVLFVIAVPAWPIFVAVHLWYAARKKADQ